MLRVHLKISPSYIPFHVHSFAPLLDIEHADNAHRRLVSEKLSRKIPKRISSYCVGTLYIPTFSSFYRRF